MGDGEHCLFSILLADGRSFETKFSDYIFI